MLQVGWESGMGEQVEGRWSKKNEKKETNDPAPISRGIVWTAKLFLFKKI